MQDMKAMVRTGTNRCAQPTSVATQAVQLSVVIVNYRTPALVEDCLASILPELPDDAAVVVVDNASGDGSVEHLRRWVDVHGSCGRVRLVAAPENVGFSGGNNLGIRELPAEHYMLVNSDTILRPGAISRLLATAERFPEAGIISPRLEWPDGTPQESCFRDHSPLSEFIAAARTGPVTSLLKDFVVPMPASSGIERPAWTSFACALLRDQLVQNIGLLDAGFFMYFEDAEYCRRARAAGWAIVHDPAARVVHLKGGSSSFDQSNQLKRRLPRYYYEARARYFYLLYGRAGLTLANVLWHVGRLVSKGRELVSGRPHKFPERQWIDIWTNWRCPRQPSLGAASVACSIPALEDGQEAEKP